jgi:cardiolipin synthase A/B
MRRLTALLFLCLLIGAAGAVEITEFCPDPYASGDPDEYFVLSGTGSLAGYMVGDGEGSVRFPSGAQLYGRIYVARNAVAFEKTHGFYPDFEMYDYSPRVPDMIRSGDLRMANSRDELILYYRDTPIQQVSWPDDVRPREGQIHYLEDGVWDPRPLFIGQSRFAPAVFESVRITAFVSPDCAYGVFSDTVSGAQSQILANVYEFTDPSMAQALTDARARGLDVRVLLEGGPVGGISRDGRIVAGTMSRGGIPVLKMTTTDDAHAKYRYNHAKYMIVDRLGVFIGSENYKPSGFPASGGGGNRGWGVYCEDSGLAAYFAEVWQWDSTGGDIVPVQTVDAVCDEPVFSAYSPAFAPLQADGARVTPVLSPDTSHLILAMLDRAESNIAIQQAYIKNETTYELNPYLAAAIDASRRGVSVAVLLDSYWFNVEGDADNDEMAALINRIAEQEGLPLEARLADLKAANVEKIHNKGVIVDGREVLVSSINWNQNSPNFNREAGVIVEHPEVAGYFLTVFVKDWSGAESLPDPAQKERKPDQLKYACAALIVAALGAVWYRHHRR